MEFFGVPTQALYGQLLIGLINGSFYALLSLGLAVIFGLLNIINFTHGAQYMMGAFVAYLMLNKLGLGYWWALLLAPLVVGATGVAIERLMLSRLYKLDHLYGLLLTFGLALIIQGLFRNEYGSSGQPYQMPSELTGAQNLGFMFLPNYRGWIIVTSLVVCLATWYVIERTKLGSYLRAATENPQLVQAFGINVPLMITLTYGFGVALAAFAGVMAAPIYQVSPQMGADLIIVVFAVVVIGGMGSIMGAILTGFGLGLIEGLTKVFYPEASNIVIFVIMVIVLADQAGRAVRSAEVSTPAVSSGDLRAQRIAFAVMVALLLLAPLVVYPVFMMKVMCFALFACAFNLLIGFGGLLSFGHAMFLGSAGYASAHAAKIWGFTPELAILFGTAVALALGVVAGLLAIRRQGIYFAMITLALAQMIFFVALQAKFTGGEDGIQSVPRGRLFGVIDLAQPMAMYSLVTVVFLAGFVLIWRVVHSPFGQVLKAIRENEPRAISLGYDADRYKLVAFVISGGVAGLAGATKALVFQLASLTDVHWTMSGEVVLMTLLGGLGTIFGPVVGAAIIITMQNYLAQLGAWVTVVQGVIFVICVLAFRRGVIGELGNWLKKPL